MTNPKTAILARSTGVSLTFSKTVGVAFAILLGSALLFTMALAGPDILHNAAHDSRHIFGFPCH
jgi:cobalt transporter subunit CbtB